MSPPLMIISGFTPKNAGFHKHQIRELSDFDGTDVLADAVRDCRIDRVFGDVAFRPKIVVVGAVLLQLAALLFHLVGGLPRAADDFADSAHRLRVRRHHADGAEIVQDVFGADGFGANSRIGKRHVFGNRRRQMMADHQHVDVFVHGVARERHRRIRG